LTFHQLDLNQDMEEIQSTLEEIRPQYVVNFAAQSEVGPSWEHPWQWFQTNAVALTRLIFFLNRADWLTRYVHISSPEVYGTCVGTVREDHPLNPSTPYAASKAAGDFSVFTYGKNYQFPFVMIRSTNVYGPHQQLFKIIPRSFINLKLDRVIELHGGGRAVKSYIHIRDISRGELLAMEGGRDGEIYHLSPDGGISVRDLVSRICATMGRDFARCTKEVAERLGQDAAYVIDSGKARSELGWSPRIGIDQGLATVNDWVEREWEAIRREPLVYVHKP
jgi:dTDP-glucose 4,6-dehydratase